MKGIRKMLNHYGSVKHITLIRALLMTSHVHGSNVEIHLQVENS